MQHQNSHSASEAASIVIVGGGTAGWMAAAFLARMGHKSFSITLVEADSIATVGVGEATIPSIQLFNQLLGIDEKQFLAATHGSIKLGIEFQNWGKQQHRYLHAFGGIGIDVGLLDFYQYWLRARQQGDTSSLWDYALNAEAANQKKFAPVERVGDTRLTGLRYAYHFDASRYAQFLRRYAENLGVVRQEGVIRQVRQTDDGSIASVVLESGREVAGDLFIDCSGFAALLIEKTLATGFDDWSHYLPCNRAIAVPSENTGEINPYTRSIAHTAGWQWHIPLQHRAGNGHVFCSDFISEDEATALLLNNLPSKPLAEPRTIRFTTGVRKKSWHKNCVALGLSSGFLEPLESTSIALVQHGLELLVKYFPGKKVCQPDVDEFNRHMRREYEMVRDFIILHYHLTERDDTPFWQHCRTMVVPERIVKKVELFKTHGRVVRDHNELFGEMAWLQVMLGQGVMPQAYHPLANRIAADELRELLMHTGALVKSTVSRMPTHRDYLLSADAQVVVPNFS